MKNIQEIEKSLEASRRALSLLKEQIKNVHGNKDNYEDSKEYYDDLQSLIVDRDDLKPYIKALEWVLAP